MDYIFDKFVLTLAYKSCTFPYFGARASYAINIIYCTLFFTKPYRLRRTLFEI